jgi:FAD/FMN-containing dehydrogenase
MRLANAALKVVRDNAALLERERPEATRSSSGYNLFELLREPLGAMTCRPTCPASSATQSSATARQGCWTCPGFSAAAKGTLGVLLEARLRVIKLPRVQAGISLYFDSNQSMAEGVVKLLETRPTKLEVLDRSFIDVAAKSDPRSARASPTTCRAC